MWQAMNGTRVKIVDCYGINIIWWFKFNPKLKEYFYVYFFFFSATYLSVTLASAINTTCCNALAKLQVKDKTHYPFFIWDWRKKKKWGKKCTQNVLGCK